MTTIEALEALRIQPGEVLILKLSGDPPRDLLRDLSDALSHVGLKDRALVLSGDIEIEAAVVPK